MGFIDTIYADGSPVAKPDVRSFEKTRAILVLDDADEVAANDLALQLVIMLKATGRLYRFKSGDTTTEVDGVNFIRDVNGLGFEIVLVQGFDGATVFVQDTAPSTDVSADSIWIDSSSAQLDLNILTGAPLAWTATGKTLKGANGVDGSSALTIVRALATSNIDISSGLENGDTIDGVTLATNDFVLLTGQTTPAENGVYVVAASGTASRASAFNTYDSMPGAYFSVMEGTVSAGMLYLCVSIRGGTLGTTGLSFRQFKTGGLATASVADFGAKGDDSTDDTAALQAAVDALNSFGTLRIPAGTYRYTELDLDNTVGIHIVGDGAIATSILRTTDTTGTGGVKLRSVFDVTCSFIHFDHLSASFTGYLVDAGHSVVVPSDTQGLYFFRCTFGSESWNKYSALGVHLNKATTVTFEGCKFGTLVRPVDGQDKLGGSYSNGVRFRDCQSFDNVGYFANYLGQGWSFTDCNFQACHDGAQRIAFSDSTTSFISLKFDNCNIYDATAADTSYLNLGTGSGLIVIGGLWGGRKDLGTSTLLSATGAITGFFMAGVTASLFTNVLVPGVTGNKGWNYNNGNTWISCTTINSASGNISGVSGNDLNAAI